MRMLALFFALALTPAARADPWQPLRPGATTFVAANPAAPRLIYAGTATGLVVSTDGGFGWTPRTKGLPDPTDGRCLVQAAAFDPDRAKVVHLGIGNRLASTGGCGAYAGRGAGKRWKSLGLDAAVSALAVAPGPGLVEWAGTTGDGSDVAGSVLKRVGGGAWQTMLAGDDVDLDVTALAVDPRNPDTVWAATNNAGVARTTDGGATWTWVNRGLPRFDFAGDASPTGAFVFTVPLVLAADDPDMLHVGTLGFGSCCPDQVGAGGDVFTSRDGGATWTGSAGGLEGVNVLALASDPARPGALYAGTTNGVFRSADRGVTWAAFGLQGGPPVWSLAVSGDGGALFAATGVLYRRPL